MVFFPVVIILTRIVFFSFYYWHIFLYVVVVVVVVVVMDRCSAGARIFSPVVSPLQIWSSMAGMNSSLLTSTLKLSLSLSLFCKTIFRERNHSIGKCQIFFFFFFGFASFFLVFRWNSKFVLQIKFSNVPFLVPISKTIGTAERSDEDFERHITPFHPLHHPQRDQVSW